MKLPEYLSKKILARHEITIPPGEEIDSPVLAEAVAAKIGRPVAVKAQVPVGGRGKAGGIKLASTPADAKEQAALLLGSDIRGFPVRNVLVEQALDIASELYLGVTIDRARRRPVAMVSALGGIDIETVAKEKPEAIARIRPDPLLGLHGYQARSVCLEAGLSPALAAKAGAILNRLYSAFVKNDSVLAEINPLVVTTEGEIIAADAKIEIDDSALFRHADLVVMTEDEYESGPEALASRAGLAYVALEGDIGIIGNGAGLVMATLDAVRLAGGRPANFLDVGGGARSDLVAAALKIVLADTRIKAVLINIFGGITRGDEVANGIINALSASPARVRLVVRLVGTEAEAGRIILNGAGITTVESMDAAAELAVA